MQRQGGGGLYQVLERASFEADWKRGIEEGWINPMADHVTLQAIRDLLSRTPRATESIYGWPENIRTIKFPRSIMYQIDTVSIYYEILEDDRTVWLERILPTIE